jgi:type I restriction enzyme M protein
MKLKSDLAAAKNEVKRLEADFLNQLRDRVGQLDASAEELLVRQILKADLMKRLDAEFAVGPRMLATRYRTWADKYAVPLLDLEARRSVAEARFTAYLKDLGYE